MLQKGVYSYEYINDWEKFNGTLLPEKEDFYSHVNMEDIADADYTHAKGVCKDFEIKHLVECHDCMFKVIHYCWLMYLRTLVIYVLEYMNLIFRNFIQL